jgi:DNA-binding transcriptional ArsR family regulator
MAKTFDSTELDAVYQALANSTRRKIITRLCKEGELSISNLAEQFDMSLAAVSKHVRVLESAGLLNKSKRNATYFCRINLEPVESAAALINFMDHHRKTLQDRLAA